MIEGDSFQDRFKKKLYIKKHLHSTLRNFLIFIHLLLISSGFMLTLFGFITISISKIIFHQNYDSKLLLFTGTCQVGIGVSFILIGIFGCVTLYFYSYAYMEGYSYFMIFCGFGYLLLAIFQILTFQSLLDWDEKNSIKLPNEISKSISWKYLQSSFDCCGYNSYTDWFNGSNKLWIPMECCKPEKVNSFAKIIDGSLCLEEVSNLPTKSEKIKTEGCKKVVQQTIGLMSVIVNIFSVIFLVLLFSIVVSTRKISSEQI